MSKKAKHLIDRMADRDLLEQAADDALAALKDKDVWYAKRFKEHREESIDKIQNMIILGEYPTKEYRCILHQTVNKVREIYPLDFDPWSIFFHAVKLVLEPIVERVLIYDTSAGRKGKGQTFGALRVEQLIRRHKGYKVIVQADLRKFYMAIAHILVTDTLRQFIEDELFIQLIERTLLDYCSDIEDLLAEEMERKAKYCASWISTEPIPDKYIHCERGVTVGSCIAQLIGNLVATNIDRRMKEYYKVKVYHRHCDDIFMMFKTIEEARYYLNRLDYECNQVGLCVKASSFVATLKDEEEGIDGRPLDYIGYVFSRCNMRMRKRNKVHCAKALHRVKSRKRRHEVLASYWGIMKWGRCKHLWNVLTNNNSMGFSDFGIKPQEISEKDGHRFFHVPQVTASEILNLPIKVTDFEDGLTIQGKPDRCAVMFEENGVKKKFITSSSIIREQLQAARKLEQDGQTVFPVETCVHRKSLGDGKNTYYMD